MRNSRLARSLLGSVAVGLMVLAALAQQPPSPPTSARSTRSRPTRRSRSPTRPTRTALIRRGRYFGDTHLHTSDSMDAGAFGCRLGPKDAYRFAKGEEVTASMGERVRLSRPLDFLVVTDHSDGLGFFPQLLAGDPKMLADPQGPQLVRHDPGRARAPTRPSRSSPASRRGRSPRRSLPLPGTAAYRDAWRDIIAAADEANDPGRFTAFIGYEWTSNTGGNNLHRNVIFRDNGSKAGQVEPLITVKPLGSDNPRDLWKWMAAYEEKTGGNVLAIAHNGNLSNGRMFPIVESFTGKPIDREYAEQRAHWERLYEATQIKGDGEAHPFLSPTDEFAAFERWDKGNLDLSELKKNEMLEYEYARSALKNGLKLGQELGDQPVQVRHDRLDRLPHRPGHRGPGQLLRQDVQLRAEPDAGLAPVHQDGQGDHHGLGDRSPPATPPCGRPTTPATRSSTPCSGARPTPPPARAWSCASSAAGISRPRTRRTACPRPSATPRACRWAAT